MRFYIWFDMSWNSSINNISYESKFKTIRFKEKLSNTLLLQEPLVCHLQLTLIYPTNKLFFKKVITSATFTLKMYFLPESLILIKFMKEYAI